MSMVQENKKKNSGIYASMLIAALFTIPLQYPRYENNLMSIYGRMDEEKCVCVYVCVCV